MFCTLMSNKYYMNQNRFLQHNSLLIRFGILLYNILHIVYRTTLHTTNDIVYRIQSCMCHYMLHYIVLHNWHILERSDPYTHSHIGMYKKNLCIHLIVSYNLYTHSHIGMYKKNLCIHYLIVSYNLDIQMSIWNYSQNNHIHLSRRHHDMDPKSHLLCHN